MRFESHEVRWFFPGAAPEAVHRWFVRPAVWPAAGELPPLRWPSSERRDRYLGIPGHDDLGIKWRGERIAGTWYTSLDVKGRVAERGVVRFGEASGRVERWTKWSCAGDAVPPALAAAVRDAPGGIEVGKRRILRKVRLDGRAGVEVPVAEPVERALFCELTAVEVGGKLWWTAGFEAAPPDEAMDADFARAVARFVEGFPGALPAEASMGYPAWLASLP